VGGVPQVIAFTYDSVGRLATVTRNGSLSAGYTYDLNGNRATKTTSAGTRAAVVDAQDRLLSYGGASYAYTAHGDLLMKVVGSDTTRYTYDALGNLTDVRLSDGTAIGYLLDPQNRRIGRTVNGVLERAWLYQGQLTPVAELDGAGTVVSRFVYATGVNVPDYVVKPGAGGDSTYRLVRDHLGSVRLLVNVASGAIAQRVSYDEFGIVGENTNPGFQPFGYAGGLTDAATGLVRFGARDYDPESGRWTAKDPIGFASGTTSYYGYVNADPVNLIDISGQVPIAPIIIGALTGAASGAFESMALQLLLNGCIDWGQVGADAALGAVGGAVTGAFVVWKAARQVTRLGKRTDPRTNLGGAFPDRKLPRDRYGRPVPDADAPHTQLGRQDGRRGSYPQAREFDASGNPVRDIDFTDHGRPGHPSPHQHSWEPNPSGGTPRRGPAQPLRFP
jgi:RHS repeat-associated protein